MKRTRLTALFMAFALILSTGVLASSGESSTELPTEIPASSEERITAAIYLDGIEGEQDAAGCVYTITADDQSGVYAKNGAVYTVSNASFTKPSGILSTATSFTVPTGEVLWSTTEAGSYGINAVALAWGEGTELALRDCVLHSFNYDETGAVIADDLAIIGANGAFATMNGKLILDRVEIIAAGEGGHGLDVTSGGIIEISDSSIVTYGKKASGITTDQPGGTVLARNVDVLTYKSGSAAVYCDGNSYVLVDGGRLESWVEPAAVVCTDGVLDLFDVELIGHEDAALNAHFPAFAVYHNLRRVFVPFGIDIGCDKLRGDQYVFYRLRVLSGGWLLHCGIHTRGEQQRRHQRGRGDGHHDGLRAERSDLGR